MSKMSSVVKQTVDANKYSVCAGLYNNMLFSDFYFYCRVQLHAYTPNGRPGHSAVTDISLQCMGKTIRGLWVTICSRMCGQVLTWWNRRLVSLNAYFFAVPDQLQAIDGHSSFIDNLMLTSNFSYFGMPIDNAVSTDTSIVVSSWYFYNSKFCWLTLF